MSNHDELTYSHTDQHSFDENQSPTKSAASSGKNEAHDVRKLLMLGLFSYVNSRLALPFSSAEGAATSAMSRHTATMSASFLSLLLGEFAGGSTSSAR